MYHPQEQRHIITYLINVCDVKKKKKKPLDFRFRKKPARALLPGSPTIVRDHDINPFLLLAPAKGLRQSH